MITRAPATMPESLAQAVRELTNPQYQHVLLLPLLVQGLILCALFVLGSVILKQSRATALGLGLLAACALAVLPYLSARAAALKAIQDAHTKYTATEIAAVGERISAVAWVYQSLAGMAVLAILATLIRARIGHWLSLLCALTGIGVALWSLDLHFRESRLYHPNLAPATTVRAAPPVVTPVPPRTLPARPVTPAR